jgi:cytochrome c oxidase assembly factor CtaG
VLSQLLAHAGQPPAPHDIWGAWNLDPMLLLGLVAVVLVHRRGHAEGRRGTYFLAGLSAVAAALVTPLDALSSALASAHMVQHILLVLVAAPLLALSAPSGALLRGSPRLVRRGLARWRRQLGLDRSRLRFLREPVTVAVLHAATLWFWHAAVPYDAALRSHPLHVIEHASFLATGVLFWRVVVGSRAAGRVSNGFAVLLVFAMAMQGVVLSMLLTFAPTPWYAGYANTTRVWHLEPLEDQQLAGAIMWVPAGLIYLGVALALFASWLNGTEPAPVTPAARVPPMPGPAERSSGAA